MVDEDNYRNFVISNKFIMSGNRNLERMKLMNYIVWCLVLKLGCVLLMVNVLDYN